MRCVRVSATVIRSRTLPVGRGRPADRSSDRQLQFLCHAWPSVPRARTSMRPLAHDTDPGALVSRPPSGLYERQPPSKYRCQSWPSVPATNTSRRPGAHEATRRRGGELPTLGLAHDPTRPGPPSVPELVVAPTHEDVEAVRCPGDRGRRAREIPAETLPARPAGPDPESVHQIAAGPAGEHVDAVGRPVGRARPRADRPAEVLPMRRRGAVVDEAPQMVVGAPGVHVGLPVGCRHRGRGVGGQSDRGVRRGSPIRARRCSSTGCARSHRRYRPRTCRAGSTPRTPPPAPTRARRRRRLHGDHTFAPGWPA